MSAAGSQARRDLLRRGVRGALAVLFIGSGVAHLVRPGIFRPLMPPYLPYHDALIYVSGVFEILGGVGLLLPATRRWAGYGLVLLLVAVFPANIHMAVAGVPVMGQPVPGWVHAIRLPLQVVLMAAVLWSAHALPVRRR